MIKFGLCSTCGRRTKAKTGECRYCVEGMKMGFKIDSILVEFFDTTMPESSKKCSEHLLNWLRQKGYAIKRVYDE